MIRKTFPTLAHAAENITHAELCLAPELSTLAALDATLLATTNLLEFNYPDLCPPEWASPRTAEGVQEHLIAAICILAKALRSNLSAYYAAIKECSDDQEDQEQIMF